MTTENYNVIRSTQELKKLKQASLREEAIWGGLVYQHYGISRNINTFVRSCVSWARSLSLVKLWDRVCPGYGIACPSPATAPPRHLTSSTFLLTLVLIFVGNPHTYNTTNRCLRSVLLLCVPSKGEDFPLSSRLQNT